MTIRKSRHVRKIPLAVGAAAIFAMFAAITGIAVQSSPSYAEPAYVESVPANGSHDHHEQNEGDFKFGPAPAVFPAGAEMIRLKPPWTWERTRFFSNHSGITNWSRSSMKFSIWIVPSMERKVEFEEPENVKTTHRSPGRLFNTEVFSSLRGQIHQRVNSPCRTDHLAVDQRPDSQSNPGRYRSKEDHLRNGCQRLDRGGMRLFQ